MLYILSLFHIWLRMTHNLNLVYRKKKRGLTKFKEYIRVFIVLIELFKYDRKLQIILLKVSHYKYALYKINNFNTLKIILILYVE